MIDVIIKYSTEDRCHCHVVHDDRCHYQVVHDDSHYQVVHDDRCHYHVVGCRKMSLSCNMSIAVKFNFL